MVTLNESLQQTTHRSFLVRKASRLGFCDIESLIQLAVLRGCLHYRGGGESLQIVDPGQDLLSDDELVILLLHGGYRYEPMAVRCAAQLLKSPNVLPEHVAFLAARERCVLALKYIASLGLKHDESGRMLWSKLDAVLQATGISEKKVSPGVLPHVSRFMSNPGIQRGTKVDPIWLSPAK